MSLYFSWHHMGQSRIPTISFLLSHFKHGKKKQLCVLVLACKISSYTQFDSHYNGLISSLSSVFLYFLSSHSSSEWFYQKNRVWVKLNSSRTLIFFHFSIWVSPQLKLEYSHEYVRERSVGWAAGDKHGWLRDRRWPEQELERLRQGGAFSSIRRNAAKLAVRSRRTEEEKVRRSGVYHRQP